MLLGTDFGLAAEFGADVGPDHEGLLCEQGDWTNGWAWFLSEGKVTWVLNFVGESVHRVTAALPASSRRLGFTFTRHDGGGATGTAYADGSEIGAGEIGVDIPFRWNPNGAFLTVGFGRGFPVCDDYAFPFPCTGPLSRVVVDISDPLTAVGTPEDLETMLRHQ